LRWVALGVAVVSVIVTVACEPGQPGGAATQFVYDAVGRLAGVIDPSGDAALYKYDAMGNILSVHRYASTGLGVMSVVPTTAPVGATVRINGTGFSTTAGSNAVTFGSAAATVVNATGTALDVKVPAGGSGAVAVTVGSSSSSWAGTFTLLTGPPAVSGLSATFGASGSSFTVNGSNFDPDRLRDAVWIGPEQAAVTSATGTSLAVTVPPGMASGPVTVTTATGTATGPSFFTLPSAVSPTGLCTQAGALGSAITPCGTNNLVTFPLDANQVFSVSCPGASGPMTLYGIDGSTQSIACQSGTQFLQPSITGGTLASIGGGAPTTVTNCTGQSGCSPPSDQIVATNPFVICDCFLALARWIANQIKKAAGLPCDGCDPVNLPTGDLVDTHTDLSIQDQFGGVALNRYYSTSIQANSSSPPVGPFGIAGTDGYDIFLSGECATNQPMFLNLPGAGTIEFDRPSGADGNCVDIDGLVTQYDQLTATNAAAPWFGSILRWEGGRDHAVVTRPDGERLFFFGNGQISKIVDRFGNTTTFVYNQRFGPSGPPKYPAEPAMALAAVIDPTGRWVSMNYDPNCLTDSGQAECPIQSASDSAGRSVTYAYDSSKRLIGFHDVSNREWDYHYDDASNPNFRTSETVPNESESPGGATMFKVTYVNHKVDTETVIGPNTDAAGSTHTENWHFAYSTVGANTETDVTFPNGTTEQDTFNPDGFLITKKSAPGTAAADTLQITRAPNTDLITQETDADSSGSVRRTLTNFYNNDNTTWTVGGSAPPDDSTVWKQTLTTADGSSFTRQLGLGTTAATWNFGLPSTETDPGPATTTFGYNAVGALTSVTSPDNTSATIGYTPSGLANSLTSGARHTGIGYTHGLPTSETDALSNTMNIVYDAAGRPTVQVAPPAKAGLAPARTLGTYNVDNTTANTVDAAGDATSFTWSRWGIASSVDPNGAHSSSQLAPGGFVKQSTDPYGKVGTVAYNDDGTVASLTSPAQVVTDFTYDTGGAQPTGRLTKTGFGRTGSAPPFTYQSTLSYGYDASNRVNSVADSTAGAGTVGDTYDDLGRLKNETSSAGTINLGYYANSGFLNTTQVVGGATTTDVWTPGGKLKSVSDGTSTMGYQYDSFGGLHELDWPGGVSQILTPNLNGDTTQVATSGLASGATSVTYGYQPSGQLDTASGADNAWLVPAGQDPATYPTLAGGGTGSRPSSLLGNTMTYDDDGHLRSDGVNNYSWNARGQLTGVTAVKDGSTVATMAYDPIGRRSSVANGGTTTSYLWRGGAIAQEKNGSTVAASNMLSPGGQTLTRTPAGSSALSVLAGPFGSAHQLVDNTGGVQNTIDYSPAGQPVPVASPGATTPDQFLGQPTDPDGLDSLDVRAYQPTSNRFLSEDPLATANQSPYAYADDDPVNRADPSGLFVEALAVGCIAGGIVAAGQAALNNPKISPKDMFGQAAKGCVIGAVFAGFGEIAFGGLGFVADWFGDLGGDAFAGDFAADAADGEAGGFGDVGTTDAGDVGEEPGGNGGCDSFSADTKVVMADGSTKAIKDVHVGDQVLATDPASGRSEARTVTATMSHDDNDLLDLTVTDGSGRTGVLHTNDHHIVWDQTKGAWVRAADLAVGDQLHQPDGDTASVAKLTERPGHQQMLDLTVETDHTFYVDDGSQAILVHNAPAGSENWTAAQWRDYYINVKGVPASELGPSGKPYSHFPQYSTRKDALDAAKNRPGAAGAEEDMAHGPGQDPHFHSVDSEGNRMQPNVHHCYPG
jgi:RHS repeat-associated protein